MINVYRVQLPLHYCAHKNACYYALSNEVIGIAGDLIDLLAGKVRMNLVGTSFLNLVGTLFLYCGMTPWLGYSSDTNK